MRALAEDLAGQLLRELLESHLATARGADLGQSTRRGASGVETLIYNARAPTSLCCTGTLAQLSRRLQLLGTEVRRDHMSIHLPSNLPAWTATQTNLREQKGAEPRCSKPSTAQICAM
eukprot:2416513-Pyramimonas_sp.AAC.1